VDIKDFILIGGGLLIAAVIAHGFWIAWRGRREPLRLDIVPDIIADNVDDIDRLRGELPNGGARVVTRDTLGTQETLELEAAPILLEPTSPPPQAQADVEVSVEVEVEAQTEAAGEIELEPELEPELGPGRRPSQPSERVEPTANVPPRSNVAEVVVPEDAEIRADKRTATQRPRRPAARKTVEKPADPPPEQQPVEELIVMNVLAQAGQAFTGDEVFAALRGKDLKFGEMNIFHRLDPVSRKVNYSVANVVEPGTFDMADMEAFRSPGLCFFLQLPGPQNPAQVFEDFVAVARDVATELGAELKDEQRGFMTPQTVEHYRQRIADFSRRRMSKRA
jgi:cell division protein ZipA